MLLAGVQRVEQQHAILHPSNSARACALAAAAPLQHARTTECAQHQKGARRVFTSPRCSKDWPVSG